MKRIRNLLLLLLSCTLAFSCLTAPALAAKKTVKLSETSITLMKGSKKTLKLTGASKKVKWSSSDKKIAAVSTKGVVTGKKKGSCVVYAKSDDVVYQCKVRVTPKRKVKLTASATKVYIPQGLNSKRLKITYTGDKRITSSSSNTNVAVTAWSSGWSGDSTYLTIGAVGAGSSVITVKEQDGSHKVKIQVTVKRQAKVGSVTGNVTFHYSKSRGYVPDTGSKVFLVPRDGSARTYNGALKVSEAASEKYHFYYTQVDGVGNYVFDRVAAGSYYVVILSKNTTIADYYKAQSPQSYFAGIADSWANLLSSRTRTALSKVYGPRNYREIILTVRPESNTTVSYAFPYSYS